MDYSMKDLKNVASLIQKSVFGKKSEYELQFNHEADGCWYVDFPGWPFDHHNLMMVAPAILTSKVVMERNIMKRVITLLLISLTLWGCRHAADSKGDEQVVGQEDVVLNDEEIEDVVSAFSLYLKDSIDEDYMRGAMSNAAEISQRYSDEEWDDAIYKENVDKVDSLMKEGIRLAKANDYDSLLSLVENLDMWDIYMHPSNNVENEYGFHSALLTLYSKRYNPEEMAPKLISWLEYSKLHFEMLVGMNPQWIFHPLRQEVLYSLSTLYTKEGRYEEALATCKEYVELMEGVNPDDDSAIEQLAHIYDLAGFPEQRDSCLSLR